MSAGAINCTTFVSDKVCSLLQITFEVTRFISDYSSCTMAIEADDSYQVEY